MSTISFRKTFLTVLPAALVAMAAVASRPAEATVYTWRDTGSTWNTGTNWQNLAVPVSSTTNSLLFNGAGSTTNNNIGGTFTQGSIDFGASAGSYTLTGNGVRLGSITNGSTATQTFSLGINQTGAGTYSANTGKIVIGGALTGTSAITKAGSGELEFTTSGKGYTCTLTANDGTVRFTASGFNSGNLVLANASDFVTTSNSVVKDFTATGNGDITVGEAGIGTLNTGNFDLSGFSGTVAVSSDGQGSLDKVSTVGTQSFGGTLNISLDFQPSNFDRLLGGEFWDFFTAATSTGNFTNVNLLYNSGTYALTNNSGIWTTTGQIAGLGPMDGFLFSTVDTTITVSGQPVTVVAGTLYAVPEPSTIVFAGIGVAMFGWSTWTRRRANARRRAVEAAIA
ncbi:MAG: PEP-CTERM sorting domain-containing protein [Planctomycetia bacterium]